MISKEQINQIKKQLIEQVESTFPEGKKNEAIKQVEEMTDEQLEEFLVQNNLIKENGNSNQKCIFCSIIDEKIPTNKFTENENAIATLDINPISKAHSLIIPKIHSENVPKQAFDLAQIVSEKIKKTFSPEEIKIIPSKIFGHEILNVLPIYNNETIDSERQKTSQKELQKIQQQLTIIRTIISKKEKPKAESKIPKKTISDKTHWLPIRIP